MLEARKALGDHEKLKGFATSSEYTKLKRVFTRATETYLRLSEAQ